MGPLHEGIRTLKDLIQHLDQHASQPLDLDSGLRQLATRHPEAESEAGPTWYWEVAAGAMMLVSGEDRDPWGLDFGPIMQGQSASGDLLTYPRLDVLTTDTLAYWRRRAQATPNPVLRARYADLAWTFAERLGGKKDIGDVRLAIDAYLDAVPSDTQDEEVEAIEAMRRSMVLALRIKDLERQTRIKDDMFALAKRLEPAPFPLSRSFLLAGFGLGDFEPVPLNDAETAYMVWLLEDVLARERADQKPSEPLSIWDAENAAQLLAAYYRKTGSAEDIRRVLEALGEVTHRRAAEAEPMVGQAWLEGYARLCEEHGQRDLAIEAIQALQALGPGVIKGLNRFSHTIEVPVEEMNRFVGHFLQGNLGEALGRLAVNMTPKWDHVVKQTHKRARENPFMSVVPAALLDGAGRPMLHMPSFETQPVVHYPMAFSQQMLFEAGFRGRVIAAIREKYGPTEVEIADWLLLSPAYGLERRAFLEKGLKAYLDGDCLVAIHLLVPQIEEALRVVGNLLGESIFVWKDDPSGIRRCEARPLSGVLNGPRFAALFSQDHLMFLKVALVVNQGLNIRNRLAHGLLLPEEFTPTLADVVFQCLLIPGLVKVDASPEAEE